MRTPVRRSRFAICQEEICHARIARLRMQVLLISPKEDGVRTRTTTAFSLAFPITSRKYRACLTITQLGGFCGNGDTSASLYACPARAAVCLPSALCFPMVSPIHLHSVKYMRRLICEFPGPAHLLSLVPYRALWKTKTIEPRFTPLPNLVPTTSASCPRYSANRLLQLCPCEYPFCTAACPSPCRARRPHHVALCSLSPPRTGHGWASTVCP